jgi:predicted transcriptional regulator
MNVATPTMGRVVARRYPAGMAMTLRLSDEETALLRRQAEREGRSMHEVVRLAIQERIARQDHADRVQGAARRVATQHREILDRLKHA